MKRRSSQYKLAVILSCLMLILMVAAVFPLPRQDKVIVLNENQIVPLPYVVQLMTPTILRVGERGKILLSLQPQIGLENGSLAVDNLLIETRLDVPGAQVFPPGSVSQPLVHEKGLDFKWQVLPARAGKLIGMLWVSVYQEDRAGGGMKRIPFMAYPLEVTVFSMLGMPVSLVKWIAGIGLMVCLVCLSVFKWK